MASGENDTLVVHASTSGSDFSQHGSGTTSSSMDLPMDDEDVQNLIKLEQRLEDSGQLDIQARKEYLETLRRCGMKEKLRDARYSLNAVFPLDEAMWLQWVQDESEALACAEDVVKLEALLQKSHMDCVSVSLWQEHIEYVVFIRFSRVSQVFMCAMFHVGLRKPCCLNRNWTLLL